MKGVDAELDAHARAFLSERIPEFEERHKETLANSLPEEPAEDETQKLQAEGDEAAEEEREHLEDRVIKHISFSKGFVFSSILVVLLLALLSAIWTDSGLVYTLLGFAPTILACIIFIGLLEGDFQDVVYWLIPLGIMLAFLGVGPWVNELINYQLDILVLSGLNLLLSYAILGLLFLIEYSAKRETSVSVQEVEEEFKPEELSRYIHTIEDKCKALNFVIGRVYRTSHGGSKELREKIKIPSEWYNEFNSIKPEELDAQKALALDLLKRIKEQLEVMLRPEKDVFTEKEVKQLKHIARDSLGKDRVLDVLSVNDQDPVEDYFLGAIDFCKRIIKKLEEL